MKVAIVGSRTIKGNIDFGLYLPDDTELIISGGAVGIDTLAEQYANAHSIPALILKPDYKKYGKGATFVRNREIVDNADLVLAFWDGTSRGTVYTVRYAMKTGKNVKTFRLKN